MINLLKKNKKTINRKTKSGFTLFVAMVVASLLLAVGFSIGNIILKQLLLSGSGKDSQVAFYAADAGAECAQFWDTKSSTGVALSGDGPFATSTKVEDTSIVCGSGAVTASKQVDGILPQDQKFSTTTLVVNYSDSQSTLSNPTENYKACAVVLVAKGFEPDPNNPTTEIPFTRITSRGYNAPYSPASGGTPAGCVTSDPRTVERGIVVQY